MQGGKQELTEAFYPSQLMRDDPYRALASYILPFNALFSFIVVGLRFRRMHEISKLTRLGTHLWRTGVVFLFLASIGLIGVGAVSMSTTETGHMILGIPLFFGNPVMALAIVAFDEKCILPLGRWKVPKWLRIYRGLTAIGMLTLAIAFSAVAAFSEAAFSAIEITILNTFALFYFTFWHRSDFEMNSEVAPPPVTNNLVHASPKLSVTQHGGILSIRADS